MSTHTASAFTAAETAFRLLTCQPAPLVFDARPVPGLPGFGVYRTVGELLPPVAWIAAGAVVFPIAVVVALGRRDGLPLDVWLRHGITLAHSPHTLTPGTARASSVAAMAGRPTVPAPLRSPVTAISPAGILTAEGADKVLIACGGTNIHLRAGAEQEACWTGSADSSTA